MAITALNSGDNQSEASIHLASRSKILFVTFMFVVSLTAFVCQTEFTSQAYQMGFGEPIILLLVTHGSWWTLWPLQALTVSFFRTLGKVKKQKRLEEGAKINTGYNIGTDIQNRRLNSRSQLLEHEEQTESVSVPLQKINYWSYFKKCIVKQFHNVYHTAILIYEANVNGDRSTGNFNQLIDQNPHVSASSSIVDCVRTFSTTPAIKYVLWRSLMITVVLTIAGGTWYGAMSLTYASDVTAIYNCSAFTAYAFAIPILKEKFSWIKIASVLIAVAGVFVVAYSDPSMSTEEGAVYPYRFIGNTIIFIGAILYGYYEVLYKKYLCIPPHTATIITPRRQTTFANFAMGLIGLFTCIFLLTGVVFVHISGIHRFNLFNYNNASTIWWYITGSIVSNLTFSASFLTLMALTSPVLSSVSSLLTIFLIGLVEWVLFGNKLSSQQLIGDFLVIVGFVLLTIASWNEISEGNDEDDVENVSTYSFALSFDNTA